MKKTCSIFLVFLLLISKASFASIKLYDRFIKRDKKLKKLTGSIARIVAEPEAATAANLVSEEAEAAAEPRKAGRRRHCS